MEGPLLAALLLPESAVAEVDADVGDLAVDGLAVVVEGGRLQDDAGGADEDGQREDPQEEAVQHHRHVLPVLLHLRNKSNNEGLIVVRCNFKIFCLLCLSFVLGIARNCRLKIFSDLSHEPLQGNVSEAVVGCIIIS